MHNTIDTVYTCMYNYTNMDGNVNLVKSLSLIRHDHSCMFMLNCAYEELQLDADAINDRAIE